MNKIEKIKDGKRTVAEGRGRKTHVSSVGKITID